MFTYFPLIYNAFLKPTIHDATCNVQHVALNFCMHHIATMLHVKLAVNVISVGILVVITIDNGDVSPLSML